LKRIAIIVPGGISLENSEYSIPFLQNLISNLSQQFDLTVYSLSKVPVSRDLPFILKCTDSSPKSFIFKRILKICFLIYRDHRLKKFDILHGFWAFPSGFLVVILSKIFRNKSIVTLLGGEAAAIPEIGYGNMLKSHLKKITFMTCRLTNELIAPTHFLKDQLTFFGFQRKSIRIIPFGADTNLFKPIEKADFPPVNFIHIGNLTPVKDQKTLLRAFKLIQKRRNCELRIIGPDYFEGELQRLAKELKIESKVKFLGPLLNHEIVNHLNWAHIMLHTSLYEGQAVVIAEAAASGVVVCGTRVGLLSDLGDEKAVTVDIGDYNSLAKEVLKLINDKNRYKQIRQNAFNWAEQYSAEWTAGKYKSLYLKLVKNNG